MSIQDSGQTLSDGFRVDRCDLTLLGAHLTPLRQIFDFSRRGGGGTKMIKNDSVEARRNLDGSGKDQDELQNSSVVGQL